MMNKYDYRVLLEKAYKEGITRNGVSVETLDEIATCLGHDEPNLMSVFGVGEAEEYGDGLCVFLSLKSVWVEEECCADYYDDDDDSYKLLESINIHESQDGIFQFPYDVATDSNLALMTKEDIIKTLTSYGLEYDPKFEEFMLDV
jgi:hypothetical protein